MRRDQNAAYYQNALKTAEKKTPKDHDLIDKLKCSLRKCELVQALASQLFDTEAIVFGKDGKMLTPTHATVQKAMKQGCKQLWSKLKIPLPNALNFLYKYFVRHFGAKKYNGKFASRLEALKKREQEGGVDKKKPKKEPASGGKRKHQEEAETVSTKLKATKKRKQKATKKTVSKPISTVTHVP